VAEPPDDLAPFAAYVRKMRLRTILQKAWMRALGLSVLASIPASPLGWHVDETRGVALLHIDLSLVRIDGSEFYTGVQLQHRSFKVFCYPYPYRKGAEHYQHDVVARTLTELRDTLGLGEQRLSSTRDYGFRSFNAGALAPAGTLSVEAWCRASIEVLRRVKEALC
jgi:hypothetical protein